MRIISGIHRSRQLISPKGAKTRPTTERVREAVFNICHHFIETADFLDLFAGSGAMGLEALSRGAISATFVEQSNEAIKAIQANINTLKEEPTTQLLRGDVFHHIAQFGRAGRRWKMIYADPPYSTKGPGDQALEREHLITALDNADILAPNGHLFIEDRSDMTADPQDRKALAFQDSRRYGKSQLIHYTSISQE